MSDEYENIHLKQINKLNRYFQHEQKNGGHKGQISLYLKYKAHKSAENL